MNKRQLLNGLFTLGFLGSASIVSAQVPLAGKIPYSSTPGSNGQRIWADLGWKVRLAQEKKGWSCTISSGAMVALVPSNKLAPAVLWSNQSYTYGALFRVGPDGTQLYAWHKGPAAPDNAAALNVSVNVKQSGQLRFPIAQKYTDRGKLIMMANVPRDLLMNVMLPEIENNQIFHLSVDQTSYGLGGGVFDISRAQFQGTVTASRCNSE